MKDARCIFVTGRRGSGKTTRVQELIEGCRRLVAFDPLGQYGREFRWPMAADIRELHGFLVQHWRGDFRIAYTPRSDFRRALHQLSAYLLRAMEPYERGRDRRKVTLIVEEMNLSVPVTPLPADMAGFLPLVLQGRHYGIEIIGVSQRPALVSADFRSACAETYVLPLGVEDHGAWGARFRGEIAGLQPHQFIRFADGLAARGENRPLPGRRAPARAKHA